MCWITCIGTVQAHLEEDYVTVFVVDGYYE